MFNILSTVRIINESCALAHSKGFASFSAAGLHFLIQWQRKPATKVSSLAAATAARGNTAYGGQGRVQAGTVEYQDTANTRFVSKN